MNIYVGNLSDEITESQLKTLFGEYGAVEKTKIISDRFSGRPKGFGFVEMPSNSEADQAIKALNRTVYEGKQIKVNPADSGGKKSKKRFQKKRF
ncbi:MAG: RNA-binding protein [Desulfotignum sp.]|nr:RNA-binding protein [Desulfotignum sp.]MCF8125922.1 RNA-binding protein [Desulfotignum sp.]